MAAGFLGDEKAHARFFHEAKAAARLQHVNIVTMFEFGEQQDTPYIVMEFLRGFSLAERMRQSTAMPLREKVDIAIQLCAGLEAAHKQGVIHRDVKPANVWLCLNGTVKLLDFGIATAASSNATVADVFASPDYMSPSRSKDGSGRAQRHLLRRRCRLRDAHRPPPVRGRFANRGDVEDRQRRPATDRRRRCRRRSRPRLRVRSRRRPPRATRVPRTSGAI